MREMRVLSATGMIGYGYLESSLREGLRREPHFIGADAGSTDLGPYYLGSGEPYNSRPVVKRDLRLLLQAAREKRIPLLIGTSGSAGGEPHLQWAYEIIQEIAREERLHFRLALIHAEQDKEYLKQRLSQGKIRPLGPVPPLTMEAIDRSERIVGMMGTEPYQKVLEQGAEVILAGRSSDCAIFAAIPLQSGFDPGLVWHMAQIVECGASTIAKPRLAPDSVMAYLRDDHFIVEPLDPRLVCPVVRVASHTLYENPHPYHLYEPTGMLDTRECRYEQYDLRCVKVSGSRFVPAEKYTIKLEGAEKVGYRTSAIMGARDPVIVARIDEYLGSARESIAEGAAAIGLSPEDYQLTYIVYGKNATLGPSEPIKKIEAHELGLLIDVVAKTPEMSKTIMAIARMRTLKTSLESGVATYTNFAVPYSPSDVYMGAAYRFSVWHLVEPDSPLEMFPIEMVEV